LAWAATPPSASTCAAGASGGYRKAASIASAVMQRDASEFTADHQEKAERGAGDLRNWLRRRADDICGAFVPQTGDLFGATNVGAGWRLLSAPIERLAAFTGDAVMVGPTLYVRFTPKMFMTAAWNTQVWGHEVGNPLPLNLAEFQRHRARLKFAWEF
jgi:hypothetical protein